MFIICLFWFSEPVSGSWKLELVNQRARYIRYKHKPSHKYAHSLLLVLPSAPWNVTITFVNQSAVEIRWLPPVVTGDQTHLYYDVSCRKQYSSNQKYLEEYCERDVSYIPNNEGLNVTQVIVANLSPFGNYSFKIYAKNRVSEVAKRRHRVEGNFTAIVVRTSGSSELMMEFVQYTLGICDDRGSVSLVYFACITAFILIALNYSMSER